MSKREPAIVRAQREMAAVSTNVREPFDFFYDKKTVSPREGDTVLVSACAFCGSKEMSVGPDATRPSGCTGACTE